MDRDDGQDQMRNDTARGPAGSGGAALADPGVPAAAPGGAEPAAAAGVVETPATESAAAGERDDSGADRNPERGSGVIPDVTGWQPPSWDEVVRQHGDRVFRLAYRLTGNRHDAEDLTQEVFVRVFRSLDSYTPGTFEGWLHRITTNLFLDMARRKQRIRFDALPDDTDRVPSGERTPAERYDDGLLAADVQAALDGLSPEFRAAVVLCDIEGLSYDEIADVLDVKLGTVRSRIHRGRAALRAALTHRARRPFADPAGGLA